MEMQELKEKIIEMYQKGTEVTNTKVYHEELQSFAEQHLDFNMPEDVKSMLVSLRGFAKSNLNKHTEAESDLKWSFDNAVDTEDLEVIRFCVIPLLNFYIRTGEKRKHKLITDKLVSNEWFTSDLFDLYIQEFHKAIAAKNDGNTLLAKSLIEKCDSMLAELKEMNVLQKGVIKIQLPAVYSNLAELNFDMQNYEGALEFFEKAKLEFSSADNQRTIFGIKKDTAKCLMFLDRLDEAKELLLEIKKQCEESGVCDNVLGMHLDNMVAAIPYVHKLPNEYNDRLLKSISELNR